MKISFIRYVEHSLCRTFLPVTRVFEIAVVDCISNFSDDKLTKLLLYGNNIHSVEVNTVILKNTIIFLKSSERLDVPLSPVFPPMSHYSKRSIIRTPVNSNFRQFEQKKFPFSISHYLPLKTIR